MYERPIDELIAERYSCRSFDGKRVSGEHRAAMEAFIAKEAVDHRGEAVRLALVEAGGDPDKPRRLGTYGTISGASLFLAGCFPKDDRCIEGFGYAFEKAVLRATGLGLGTCWLAGTLDRKVFGQALDIAEGEFIPAVTPLGYAASRPKLNDALTRALVSARKRKAPAEIFFDQDGASGLPGDVAARFARPLEALRLAPSATNRQPWRLCAAPAGLRFFVRRTPIYGSAFGFDLQRMDLGIAMCHFQLSAEEAGITGRWEYETSPGAGPEGSEYVVSWMEGR